MERNFLQPLIKWKRTAVLVLIGLMGGGVIALSTIVLKGLKPWEEVMTHVGIAFLAGAVIGLVFDFMLIRDVVTLLGARIRNVLMSHRQRDRELRRVGIKTAFPRFGPTLFAAKIPKCERDRDRICVRIMQSWVHHQATFQNIIATSIERNQAVHVLVGHPRSAAVCQRLMEAHEIKTTTEASDKARQGLVDLLRFIGSRPDLRKHLGTRLMVRLYDARPAGTIFGIGRDILVSWFFRKSFGVGCTQIWCTASDSNIEKLKERSDRLADHALIHYRSLWEDFATVSIGTSCFNAQGEPTVPPLKAVQIEEPRGVHVGEHGEMQEGKPLNGGPGAA